MSSETGCLLWSVTPEKGQVWKKNLESLSVVQSSRVTVLLQDLMCDLNSSVHKGPSTTNRINVSIKCNILSLQDSQIKTLPKNGKFLSGYTFLFSVLGPTVGPMVVNTRISS